MEYRYLPDSYDYKELFQKNISANEFLKLQVKYKQSFENLLKSIVYFNNIDLSIEKLDVKIPTNDISDNNFYKKFSSLGSKYIFLRNNIHIERLSDDEINEIYGAIMNNCDLSPEYLQQTLEKVLFEDGDFVYYGTPINKNKTSSRSIVFEFSYNDKECSIEEGKKIENYCKILFGQISILIQSKINTSIEFIISEGFEDKIENIRGIV